MRVTRPFGITAILIAALRVSACADDAQKLETPVEGSTANESKTPDPKATIAVDEPTPPSEPTSIVPPEPFLDASAAPSTPAAASSSTVAIAGGGAGYAYIMPMAATNFLWVYTDHLNVRAEPSVSAPKLGKLRWGKKVAALATQDDWVKISEGAWVARSHLTDRIARWHAKEPSPRGRKPRAPAGGGAPYRVVAEVLNIRDQPGPSGQIVGQLTHGSIVRGIATTSGWLEIQPGQYVSGAWLSAGTGPVAH